MNMNSNGTFPIGIAQSIEHIMTKINADYAAALPKRQWTPPDNSMPFTAWDEAKQQEVEVVCELVDLTEAEDETRSTPGCSAGASIGDVFTLDGRSFTLSDHDHEKATEQACQGRQPKPYSWTGGDNE